MSIAELATVGSAFLVCGWLAARATSGVRWFVLLTGLVVSGAMFLPSPVLAAIAGPELVEWMTVQTKAMHWSLSAVAHFVAFFWLSAVIWGLRPDLRGWRAAGVLILLSVFSELVQGLGAGRSPRLDDAQVNLVGVGCGLVVAELVLRLFCARSAGAQGSDRPGGL